MPNIGPPKAPPGYASAVSWLPATCRAMGIDPASIDDDTMRYVEAGIRAAFAAVAVDSVDELLALRLARAEISQALADVERLRLTLCEADA